MAEQEGNNDVPKELKENKESKDLVAQQAEDELRNAVPKDELILAAIGYVSFLCILPLILKKDSEYCQHHAHQALILAIGIYFLDAIHVFPAGLASVYILLKYIIILFSIFIALKGKKHKLPFIYNLSKKFEVTIK